MNLHELLKPPRYTAKVNALHRPYLALFMMLLLTACNGRSDALAPIITITEPQGTSVRPGKDLQIIGYAMDDTGLAKLAIDGQDILSAPAFAGERNKKLINFGFRPQEVKQGLWRSEVTAEDVDGRVTQHTLTLEIDGTPPKVSITGIEALENGRQRISGTATDNDMVRSITASGVQLSFTPAPEVPFSFETAGDIQLTITDQAGNVTNY